MARKSRSKTNPSSPPRRVIHNANLRLPNRAILPSLVNFIGEDHRRFHPNGPNRRLRLLSGRPILPTPVIGGYSRPKHSGRPRLFDPFRVNFVVPRTAVICVRRQIRKEVMFATGRGGSRRPQKRPHLNSNSSIICRRS